MSSPSPAARSELKQPPGLYVLAGVEMWERFSFYGMKAFLVFFLTSTINGGFGWGKEAAGTLLGIYSMGVYLSPLLGGFLADRVLGTHRAIIVGSFLITIGHFTLALPGKTMFFLGLVLIMFGTGFHKSNISTMVGQLFKGGDVRRDSAFTIFHMAINVGGMLGPIVCGGLAESPRFGWHWGFASAGVFMVIGTASYLLLKRRFVGDIGDVPGAQVMRGESRVAAADVPLTKDEVDRLYAIVILCFFNIFFWVAFEQTGSSLNFFARERTDLHIFGFDINASAFQSVNSVCILVFAPLFAWMWPRLAVRKREPSTPAKFALGLSLVSLGFVVMVVAAKLSEGGVKVSPLFLVLTYMLHTWGELSLYPVGLSMVTKLAPVKVGALMMGVFFSSMALAELTAGILSGQVERVARGEVFHVLGGQADFFLLFVIAPGLAALVLFLCRKPITRLMHGLG